MVLLANGGQEEAHFDSFGDSVNLIADRCTVCTECTSGMEIALGTPEWYSKVMCVNWKIVSVRFEIVLVLAQDRCTVCAECSSRMKIILGTPDHTPR